MKRFFTLIAAALLCSGAFAQGKWNNLVVNGDMEGEQDPMWSSFWVHDWRQDVQFAEGSGQSYDEEGSGQFRGFAEIVEDPANPSNHCARVIARSYAEAEAAGIMTPGQSEFQSWDSQFFIYGTDTIPEGMELRMTLKVKADRDCQFETQAHYGPGDYNYWQCFGNVNVTTEWTTVEVSTTVSANMAHSEGGGKFMQSVAFNLSVKGSDDVYMGNTFYFDDVKLEWRKPKEPEPFTGFFNMLRHGTLSNDKIQNFTTFTGRDARIGEDRPARVVDDPVDGQPALTVNGAFYEGERQAVDDDGNPKFDEEGNPVMETYYTKEDGTIVKGSDITDWQCQFFVTVPHKFIPNSKYRLKMWYRADVEADVDTQLHNMPGGYVHYQAFNTIGSTLHFTPEWQLLEIEEEMRSEGKNCQTIAFNTNKYKDSENNYYFRFEEFAFNDGDVTEDERTLNQEDVMLPVPEPANVDGAIGTIDFAECMSTLETESFESLIDNMEVRSSDDTYEKVDASAGFYVADNGWLSANETPISFEFDEISDENPVLTLTTFNSGDSFAGKSITSKFRYNWKKWFYIFNVNLVPEESYTGISEVKAPVQNNIMYDLSGRRIQNATKGLYIMNGKKYFAK